MRGFQSLRARLVVWFLLAIVPLAGFGVFSHFRQPVGDARPRRERLPGPGDVDGRQDLEEPLRALRRHRRPRREPRDRLLEDERGAEERDPHELRRQPGARLHGDPLRGHLRARRRGLRGRPRRRERGGGGVVPRGAGRGPVLLPVRLPRREGRRARRRVRLARRGGRHGPDDRRRLRARRLRRPLHREPRQEGDVRQDGRDPGGRPEERPRPLLEGRRRRPQGGRLDASRRSSRPGSRRWASRRDWTP